MLRVHTADGLTTSFDLEDEEQASEWLLRLQDPSFQNDVTGITIAQRGVLYSFSKPQNFHNINFHVEHVEPDLARKIKGGERVRCFADGICVGLMVHKSQKAVRVTLAKIGTQKFNPFVR